MRTSFTFGDAAGIDAAVENMSELKYSMALNATDLHTVCTALNAIADSDENASSLLSGILETLGIEYI